MNTSLLLQIVVYDMHFFTIIFPFEFNIILIGICYSSTCSKLQPETRLSYVSGDQASGQCNVIPSTNGS